MNIWIPKIGWAAALFNLLASGPERWWCRFAIEDVALCDLRCGTLWARRWHFVNNKLGGGEAQNGRKTIKTLCLTIITIMAENVNLKLPYVLLADKCSGQTARAYWIQNEFLCFYFRDNIWAIRAASARAGLPVAVKGNWSTEST